MTTTYLLDTATPLTMVLAEQTGTDPAISYLHGLDLVAQSDGATTEYFAYDGLGSVRQVVDETGSPLLTQTFDPYGSLYSRAGIAETAWGFTGEQTDANGLLYLRARYYAPSQGRFFLLDPSRLEVNLYQYANSSPLNFADASGLCADPNAENYDGVPERYGGSPCRYSRGGIIYTDLWNSDWYGGCQKCHAAQAFGTSYLYSDELAAYDTTFRQRSMTASTVATILAATVGGCYIGGEAILACAINPACWAKAIAVWSALDWIDDRLVVAGALAGDEEALNEYAALAASGLLIYPVEGPYNSFNAYILRKASLDSAIPDSAYFIRTARDAHTGILIPFPAVDTSTFEHLSTTTYTQRGYPRDYTQYWKAFRDQFNASNTGPLSNDNIWRIENGFAPRVDTQWVSYFPEHAPYMGDTIIHHHVGYGPYAIPLPRSIHRGMDREWHP